ncbi:hypothetical protein C0581_03890 [Candidatus Parcubacteria bacterium]|nr:MAG: hypothetical protein C0581_03890 [Candidatus Parcubacteria bacterium]
MQKLGILLTSCALVLVLGAGCSKTETSDSTQSKSADTEMSETPVMETGGEIGTGDIELSAQATGKNTVSFDWRISKGLEDKAEGWRIVYGKDANPTYPSTWWFERSKPHREKVWAGLPAGKAHFRVCAVIGKTCDIYSNNVEVEIAGAPAVEEILIEDEKEEMDEAETVTEETTENSATSTEDMTETTDEDKVEETADDLVTSTEDVVETTDEEPVEDATTTTEQ